MPNLTLSPEVRAKLGLGEKSTAAEVVASISKALAALPRSTPLALPAKTLAQVLDGMSDDQVLAVVLGSSEPRVSGSDPDTDAVDAVDAAVRLALGV